MADWDAWIGRKESCSDRIDPGALGRWLAMLDRDAPADGTVPQGYNWCLGLPGAPTARLGPDGHPLRDDSAQSFLPPVPLPRRMWASSTLQFLNPLRTGEAVTRTSRILSVVEKTGGSGRLVFVEIGHETCGENGLAVRDTQSIVYRDAAAADTPLSPPPPGAATFDPAGWDAHRVITPTEALLFRYSALTFNSHRIHYDLPYAQGVERYRGLVVHGPLTASLLLDLARRQLGDNALARFAFRGHSPAICGEAMRLLMRGTGTTFELAAFAADGRQVMAASATRKD
ncbi:MAG: MaoC family dehydratase N-terminal domain-containing protein [Blastomonas fulva]|uniref:FAS1-like dehydratase domain-containing protein n=1 Tax=Blastomonas fulva TaxID=1550728 RepID=UPI0024E19C4F|nr:MaoC family dehydratase N-terminal domain-containing protein [Blastomonas fulva]MDK2758195.1 MaoC family dehydratase N-terminal domain-containing protein [Blastomonas fulva]